MAVSHQGFIVGDGEWKSTCTNHRHDPQADRNFVGRAPNMTSCFSCWYADEMYAAEQRFAPVLAPLEAAGIPWSIDQTGGMVMCLRLELPPISEPGDHWMWVSELDELVAEGELWVSSYRGEEDGQCHAFNPIDYDDEGEIIEPDWHQFGCWLVEIHRRLKRSSP